MNEADPGWQFLRQSVEAALKDQTKSYDSKKNCWIPDPEEGFVEAVLQTVNGDIATVTTVKGEQNVKQDQCLEMNPPKFEKTEDMANLTFLNEAAVLHNLKARYYSMMIYTYSGLFCVVINPYKRLPIYSESVIKMYLGRRRNEMPPHLFAVADEAYRNMVIDKENQSMLITGESGAGKTENTKKVIAYFAIVGATQQAADKTASADGKRKATLEEQIVQTNPVLEAFGNAKTVRNNNSSRFGKFIRTHFSKDGRLAGGDIEHYLLEKSRVIRQAPGERCYHVYYQIMSGHNPQLRSKLHLSNDLVYYHFCAQAELTIEGVDDKDEMRLTDEAFDVMNFEQSEKDDLYKLVAAIMHMGEMKFKQRPREEQAEIDENKEDISNAASLFGVSDDDFGKALIKPRVRVGNEWVNKGQNLDQVNWAVGALAKAIYARMFHWLIKRCNKTLDAQDLERKFFIGVLDIAGFEIFDFNSFEQLWINFVNERLQQFFNHHMFVLEQEEYQREGIKWEFIDFGLDLQQCIELIEKPLGILSILDEECIVPKATDLTLAQKLNDQHLGKHPNFQKPKPPKGKQGEAHFAVVHYAGVVRYNVMNWLEKNKDPLNDTAVGVLKTTETNQLLQDIWEDYQTQEEALDVVKAGGTAQKKGKSASFMTVSVMYRESLNNLMNMLNQTHPHFIRCIIPNELKRSGLIDSALVLNQLTCNGVLEGIRICRKGFPNRMLYPDYRHRYSLLAADAAKSSPDPKKASDAIMKVLINEGIVTAEEYRIGETKIFFKAGVLAKLEDHRDAKLSHILKGLQSRIRSFTGLIDKQRRREQSSAVIIIQNNIREWLSLRTWQWMKLYGRVKPLCTQAKYGEEMEKLKKQLDEITGNFEMENKAKSDLAERNARLLKEKEALVAQMEKEKNSLDANQQRLSQLESQQSDLERQAEDLASELIEHEEEATSLQQQRKQFEQQFEGIKHKVSLLEMALKKAESERQAREHQIRSMQDDLAQFDQVVAKTLKEHKSAEEVAQQLMQDLEGEQNKLSEFNDSKAKADSAIQQLAAELEREKQQRIEAEKSKRRAEGEVKIAYENVDELEKQKRDTENSLKRKEIDYLQTTSRLEEEQFNVAKIQKQLKDIQAKLGDLEDELSSERAHRTKVEKQRSELQRDLEELSERLSEAGGATAAQFELNKKREAELAGLRRDYEASRMNHEGQLFVLHKKYADAVSELGEQLDELHKAKARLDREKVNLQRELLELQQTADREAKAKLAADAQLRQMEAQLTEYQSKVDDQTRLLADFATARSRLTQENADLTRQLQDAQVSLEGLLQTRQTLFEHVSEAKHQTDEVTKERLILAAQVRNIEHENDNLRQHYDEEEEARVDLQRQLAKAETDVVQWKAKLENEALAKLAEIEEAKRKLQLQVNEVQDQITQANAKALAIDKQRIQLIGELDDAQIEIEKLTSYALQLEKKQQNFEKQLQDWSNNADNLASELDASQRENRNTSTEIFKLRAQHDELSEQIEALKRENRTLSQELKDLTSQLTEGGKLVHELQKTVRRLEQEKQDLQTGLDEAETALEVEEQKVLRAQLELSQVRQEVEKRIREKEEEFENVKKNFLRSIESLQATLEAEAKARAEALRIKKNLEAKLNELEISLDQANKANSDAQKAIKLLLEKISELQISIEEEQRQRDELQEQYDATERRVAVLQAEQAEIKAQIEQADRGRRNLEAENSDVRSKLTELTTMNNTLTGLKRKLEDEVQRLQGELTEILRQLKESEERSKKAMQEAARLAEELSQEQEHSTQLEHSRRALEDQLNQLQAALAEAEASAMRGGRKIIEKLELRIRQLEQEFELEQRRYQEADKAYRKNERHIKELQFQVEEDRKSFDRMQELNEQLQTKIAVYKRQISDAEEATAHHIAKYRQVQSQLDEAVERADMADLMLAKMRLRNRGAVAFGTGGLAPALATSQSSAAILRSASSRLAPPE